MARLSFAQLRTLWMDAGGAASLADTMAAVALAESGGDPDAINPESCRTAAEHCLSCTLSNTGDYSIGLWQINYYGRLFDSRKADYGCPGELWTPIKNARAAVDIAGGGGGLSNWTTYTSGAYRRYLAGAPTGPQGPVQAHAHPHTVRGPVGPVSPTAHIMTFPAAFNALTYALGRTIPTRVKLANHLSRQFSKVVR